MGAPASLRQLFDFIFTTTIIGLVLWPCTFVLLQVLSVFDLVVHLVLRREVYIIDTEEPGSFRLVFFLQTISIWGIYGSVFATFAVNFVTDRHIARSWLYGLAGLLLMLFYAFMIVRTSARNPNRRDIEYGNVFGMWVALLGYALFYKYPEILRNIPGAITAYGGLTSLTDWLMGVWFFRSLVSRLAFGALLPLVWLIFYWMSVGFGHLDSVSQRLEAESVKSPPSERQS